MCPRADALCTLVPRGGLAYAILCCPVHTGLGTAVHARTHARTQLARTWRTHGQEGTHTYTHIHTAHAHTDTGALVHARIHAHRHTLDNNTTNTRPERIEKRTEAL